MSFPGSKNSQTSWTSVTDETDAKHTNPFESPHYSDGDGSGFLHPESTLESNRELQSSAWAKERSAQQVGRRSEMGSQIWYSSANYKADLDIQNTSSSS